MINLLKTILVVIVLIFSFWVFNHINPWIGILLTLLVIYYIYKQIINKKV